MRRVMRPVHAVLLPAFCAVLSVVYVLPFAPAAEATLADKARMLIDYQSFARGDRDGAVRFSISAARELQGTPLAELAVRIALAYEPASLSAVTVGEMEARRLLSAEAELTPELRDLLRRFVARSLATAGRREEAKNIHRQRGLAMAWLIAGPFENLSMSRFDTREFPETGAILDRDVVGRPPTADDFREWRRRPPWQVIPENRSFPQIRPWRIQDSASDGAMLLLTGLETVESDPQAAFQILSDTSWRLFVDGILIAEVDKNNHQVPTEHTIPFPLVPGKRVVVLQLFPPRAGIKPQDARVALRLESSAAFSWTREVQKPAAGFIASSRREARRMKYLTDLQAAATDNPAVAVAYAMAAAEQGMADVASWWTEMAAGSEPANVNYKVLAGVLAYYNPLLPPDRRRDQALKWHREALAAKHDIVPSLLFMAKVASEAGQAREAARLINEAAAVNPSSLDVLIAKGEWARTFASGSSIRAAWDECARVYPNSPSVQLTIASMPQDGFLDMERRLTACRAALEAGPYDPEAGLGLAGALADAGNRQEAEAVLLNLIELFAGDVNVLVRIAGIYSRLSLYGEAMGVMSDAVRIAPANARLWRTMGDFAMASGDAELAKTHWRTSLAADPGQFELAEMIDQLESRPNRLYQDGDYDAIALTAAASRERYQGDVVRLLDRSVITFAADGSYQRLTHEVDLAGTLRGGDSLSNLEQHGELIAARIVFPNGNTLEPEPFPGRGGLRLPVVMPGAAREMRFLESHPAVRGRPPAVPPWYFQDPSGRMQFLVSEYVVRAPRNFPLVNVVRDLGRDIEYEFTQEDDYDVYRWTARLPPPRKEPDSVQVSERVPSVELGVKATWDDIVRQELRRLDGRLIASMRMRALVNNLKQTTPQGMPDPMGTAKAIYRYVCDTVDPAPGGDTAAHVYADSKGDRALLLHALLRAADIVAHPAAARPDQSRMSPPTWDLPSRDIFTIPLVRMEAAGGVQWLDVRFDSLPFGKIADDLSGAKVLAFLPEGPLFETLPGLPAEESIVFEEKRLQLPPGDGPVTVSGRSVVRGTVGLRLGQEMDDADPEGRKRLKLTNLYPVFPDAVLKELDVIRPGGDEAAAQQHYELASRIPVEERPGGTLAVSLCLAPPGVISAETRNLGRRYTACHIESVHIAEDRNIFVLPPDWTFTRLPRPAHIPSRFGLYQLRVVPHGEHGVEVIRKYHIPAQRVRTWEWIEFIGFLDRIDLAEKQWIEYARVAK